MPRIFTNLEAGCLQVNLMSTSAQINQLKYTILYYTILKSSKEKKSDNIQSQNVNLIIDSRGFLQAKTESVICEPQTRSDLNP